MEQLNQPTENNKADAEVEKIKAETERIKAETKELSKRSSWIGPSIIRYLVGGAVLGCLLSMWLHQFYLPLKSQQDQLFEREATLRKLEVAIIEKNLQLQKDSVNMQFQLLLKEKRELESSYSKLGLSYKQQASLRNQDENKLLALQKEADSNATAQRMQIEVIKSSMMKLSKAGNSEIVSKFVERLLSDSTALKQFSYLIEAFDRPIKYDADALNAAVIFSKTQNRENQK